MRPTIHHPDPHGEILAIIATDGPQTVTTLSDALRRSRSSVGEDLAALIADGRLVSERRLSPHRRGKPPTYYSLPEET